MRNRGSLLLLWFVLATSTAGAPAAGQEVQVVRNGQRVAVARAENLAAKPVALAESCAVNSSGTAVACGGWEQALASGSCVQVGLPRSRS